MDGRGVFASRAQPLVAELAFARHWRQTVLKQTPLGVVCQD
jgi:hypothetical protein